MADQVAKDSDASACFDLSEFENLPKAVKRMIENQLRNFGCSQRIARRAVDKGFDELQIDDSASPDLLATLDQLVQLSTGMAA